MKRSGTKYAKLSFPRSLSLRKQGAGIQPFYKRSLDSCLRRSDNRSVPLFIQEAIECAGTAGIVSRANVSPKIKKRAI
jgi:hypothetical protein